MEKKANTGSVTQTSHPDSSSGHETVASPDIYQKQAFPRRQIFPKINGYMSWLMFYGTDGFCIYIGKEDIVFDILRKTIPDPQNPQQTVTYFDYNMLATMQSETIYRPFFLNGKYHGFRNFQDEDAEAKVRSIFENMNEPDFLAQLGAFKLIDGSLHFQCQNDATRYYKFVLKDMCPFTTMVRINLIIRRDGGTEWQSLQLDWTQEEFLQSYMRLKNGTMQTSLREFCLAGN